MSIIKILVALASTMFIMIGADKFLSFLEPPCSMEANISPIVWKLFGILQIAAGILIWMPKYRKAVAGFFSLFMLFFTIVHILNGTYDIGGSVFMAILLGLIVWNPSWINTAKS